MSQIVPLHSLVLVLDENRLLDPEEHLRSIFPAHEVTCPEDVLYDLVGEGRRVDLEQIALNETRRRVSLKLALGERVVLHGESVRTRRAAWERLAHAQGASILHGYFGSMPAQAGDDDLALGDRARVWPVPASESKRLARIRSSFRGVTVVGDVHGERDALRAACAWARGRNHFLILLGDFVAHGPDTLEVVEDIYSLVMNGEAAIVLGNHERKIAKWIAAQEGDGDPVRLNEGSRVTAEALRRLNRDDRARWIGRFRSLIGRSSVMLSLGDVVFAHGSVHPDYWHGDDLDHEIIEDYALYGEPGSSRPGGAFQLGYRWVEAVPKGTLVFVGHDTRSQVAPTIMQGAEGGQVVFLDTGAGKPGGCLSTADLRFSASDQRLVLENFNRHTTS